MEIATASLSFPLSSLAKALYVPNLKKSKNIRKGDADGIFRALN